MTAKINMGVFPSGQWGQTVNLLLSASVVRIHPRPPRTPVSEPGTGVSVLSVLQKGLQGWIRTASTRRIVRRVKKPLRGFFRCAARAIHPRPPRTPVSNGYWSFCFICLAKGAARVDSNSIDPPNSPAGESPCATATTAASGRNREELLGLRPAGCACRPRHDAAAGSRDPGSFSARLATSARTHIASVPDL